MKTRMLMAGCLLVAASGAQAQQATERFVPIGQSPGVSGKYAMMGTVVGYADGMLTVASPAYPQPQRVRMMPSTRVWLDRSAAGQAALSGGAADLVAGRRIEIGYANAASRDAASWVKVQMAP